MTLAERLAEALVEVLRARSEALALVLKGLTERRDELRRVVSLPADAERLELQHAKLEGKLKGVRERSAALEEELEQLGADFERKYQAVRARLVAACGNELELQEAARSESSFNEAVSAFGDVIAGRGAEPGRSTPAQLRQHIPYLQMVADHVRERARKLLEDAGAELAETPARVLRQREYEDRRRELAGEFEAVAASLRAHQNSGELPLVSDIAAADVATVRRIKREVLRPLLDNALIERQKGLAGSDPLDGISAL
jgi:chromosome segregation ATPase